MPAENLKNIHKSITDFYKEISILRNQSFTNAQGIEILNKLENIKSISNESYNISNSTSIINEAFIIQLFEAQSKKIDAIQEKLNSKPENENIKKDEQNSHSNKFNNETVNQQPNDDYIKIKSLIEEVLHKLAKLEYVYLKSIN